MTLGNHILTMFLVYLLDEVANRNGGPQCAYPEWSYASAITAVSIFTLSGADNMSLHPVETEWSSSQVVK